jgi:hypothetical protein
LRENDTQITKVQAMLDEAVSQSARGRRRLITEQGDSLREEAAAALRDLGFEVDERDEEVQPGQPRREDLRIRDSSEEGWEAISEVRGHERSSGKTSDFHRLHGWAALYEKEKGRPPDRLIYLVNGPLEDPPDQRPEPFASAAEDVEEFGQLGGVVISTLDLFRVVESERPIDREAVRASIRRAIGRWKPP